MKKLCCGFMERFNGYGLTAVRVILGIIFVVHGAHKVIGWPADGMGPGGLANTVAGMGSMGMSPILIYLVSFGELLAGIGLILGIACRLAALAVLVIMIGAIVMVHGPNGFFINWMQTAGVGHGYECNLALAGMSLAVLLSGPGRLALCCHKKDGCCQP